MSPRPTADRQDRMAQNARAPAMDRMQPDTLIRGLPILVFPLHGVGQAAPVPSAGGYH